MGTVHDFTLLAHDPQKGTALVDRTALNAGIAGAILADLLLERRLGRDERGRFVVLDARPLGEPALDRALAWVVADRKPRSAARWIGRWNREEVRRDVLASLVAAGAMTETTHRVLGLFPTKRHPATGLQRGQEAAARVTAVLSGATKADDSEQALIGILDAAEVLRRVIGRFDRHVLAPFRDNDVPKAVRSVISSARSSAAATTGGGAVTAGTISSN